MNDRGPTVQYTRGELIGPPPSPRPDPPPENPDALASAAQLGRREELARLESSAAAVAAATSSAAAGAAPVVWSPVHYEAFGTESGAGFRLLADNSLLSDGPGSFNDTYRIDFTTTLAQVVAIRLRTLTHDSLPKTGPGLAFNGNFVLTDFELSVDGKKQVIVATGADHEQPGFPVAATNRRRPQKRLGDQRGRGRKNVRMNADHEAWFVMAGPLPTAGKTLRVRMLHDLNQGYLVGRFVLEVAATPPALPPVEIKKSGRQPGSAARASPPGAERGDRGNPARARSIRPV